MKKIGAGVYVEENEEGFRSYILEAEYSDIARFDSHEQPPHQEIQGHNKRANKNILDHIKRNYFDAELTDAEIIFVETDEPTKLVKVLCDGNFIDSEQATAIMAHEIEYIRNPKMLERIKYQQVMMKEVREIVIQHKISQSQKKPSVKAKLASGKKSASTTDKTRK